MHLWSIVNKLSILKQCCWFDLLKPQEQQKLIQHSNMWYNTNQSLFVIWLSLYHKNKFNTPKQNTIVRLFNDTVLFTKIITPTIRSCFKSTLLISNISIVIRLLLLVVVWLYFVTTTLVNTPVCGFNLQSRFPLPYPTNVLLCSSDIHDISQISLIIGRDLNFVLDHT